MIRRLIGVTLWLALSPLVVGAQGEPTPVRAEWVLGEPPPAGWTVGDPIPLRLEVTYPAAFEVTLPELPEQWGNFEVAGQTSLSPSRDRGGTVTAVHQVTVRLWAPGDHPTPPLNVRYRDAGGQRDEVAVSPVTVTVASVLSPGEAGKRGLKPQVSLPRPPLWPWLLGGALSAGLVGVVGWFLLGRLRRRPAPTGPVEEAPDTRSPAEIALLELARIAALDLPARGELKGHYTLVADCMRRYVEGRYHVRALDRTTEELIGALRRARADGGQVQLLRDLLTEADRVKFAKARPSPQRARAAVERARHIVRTAQVPRAEGAPGSQPARPPAGRESGGH